MTPHSRRRLNELRSDYRERRVPIKQRLEEFRAVPPAEVVHELFYCLLTPQSSAVNAGLAVERIRAAGCAADPQRTAAILRSRENYIRFHNTKALRIERAYRKFPALEELLRKNLAGEELRIWLVENISGLGWKESSHFLRNIGYRNLAILDRHILRNLCALGVIRRVPVSLTPKRYGAIEKAFRRFAARVRIPMDELDLLFWSRETGRILK